MNLKRILNQFIPIYFLFLPLCVFLHYGEIQAQTYKLHSHNDYLRDVPFWEAYANSIESIEADVILMDGTLYVAHEKESIKQEQTLKTIYLDPIRKAFDLKIGHQRPFQLLVDIKTEAYSTLNEIVKELEPYQEILQSKDGNPNLTIVISGNRPNIEDYFNYPPYIQFDYQSIEEVANLPLDKIELISLNFRSLSSWNGKGRIVDEEVHRIENAIKIARRLEKPIRFWATPDSKTAWKALKELGVDYINTDMPFEARNYLATLDQRIYTSPNLSEIYCPLFEVDGIMAPVDNIILLIGDGNGLAQISAAMFANNNRLNLTKLKNIGLIKTASLDDFTTDSAAAGSALATGHKVKNRSISLLPDGEKAESIMEYLKKYNYLTGIVTSDNITGATPAAFYAHQSDRDKIREIAHDLIESKLNLFIGGGKNDFLKFGENQLNNLESRGFQLAANLKEIGLSSSEKIGYFGANQSLPTVVKGRKGFLAEATDEAIKFLSNKSRPFFLMVEGAYIDSGGHNNHTETIVEEGIDFDEAISRALKFADIDGKTLVIITADHETGGVTLPQGHLGKGSVELDFQSNDHTGSMVPLFCYGPHSNEFRGVYENTEVFHKVVKILEQYLSN